MINPEVDAPGDFEAEGFEEEFEEGLEEGVEGGASAAAPGKGGIGRWILILVVLGGLGAGGWFGWQQFSAGNTAGETADATPAEPKPGARSKASYLSLDPPLVVNFAAGGQLRYLQVSIEVMTLGSKETETIQRHMPAVRNALISLLSERDYEALLSREGKEALRLEALETIRAELSMLSGEPAAEDVYFTSFVMQ